MTGVDGVYAAFKNTFPLLHVIPRSATVTSWLPSMVAACEVMVTFSVVPLGVPSTSTVHPDVLSPDGPAAVTTPFPLHSHADNAVGVPSAKSTVSV